MIYIVEDDRSIRDLECYALEQAGYKVRGFEDGARFFKALDEALPELVLLDVMLPGEDGYAILLKLRNNVKTKNTPIIMLTAKGEEIDKVQALDGGADDYIVKPFGVMEMLSRVKAVLRRTTQKSPEALLVAKGLTMDVARHQVIANGETVTLTHMEFGLLRYFIENQGMALTREQLLNAVWSMDYVGDTRTVDVHVRMLRQKLGASGDQITTVRGIGYRMEA